MQDRVMSTDRDRLGTRDAGAVNSRSHGRPGSGSKRRPSVSQMASWIALLRGAMQVLAPASAMHGAGIRPGARASLGMRLMGARQVAQSLSRLDAVSPSPWTSLSGNLLDAAFVLATVGRRSSDRRKAAVALLATAGLTALDVRTIVRERRRRAGREAAKRAVIDREDAGMPRPTVAAPGAGEEEVERDEGAFTPEPSPAASAPPIEARSASCAVLVERPAVELYAAWRDFGNLPHLLSSITTVSVPSPGRLHCTMSTTSGTAIAWDAELTDDAFGRRIAWRSVPDSVLDACVSVSFEEDASGRSTTVRVRMEYHPVVTPLGDLAGRLLPAETAERLRRDLEAFKGRAESGAFSLDGMPQRELPGVTDPE
jgi:uncharacterized membrane protein